MGMLRDTIRSLTARHLDAGYSVLGQCVTAVGHVGNTVPDDTRVIELPCSDVSNAGVVVGHALAGKRPIYLIRYQGFSHLNAPLIVNYAAKSKELWGKPCPILIRGVAMEGGIGPVAGSSHHALWNMPGVKIYSPMTSDEWRQAYEEFMAGDDVVYLSEHRGAWGEAFIHKSLHRMTPRSVLFPISITREAAFEAALQAGASVFPLWRLRPLDAPQAALDALRRCGRGLVIDDANTPFAKAVAHDLASLTGARMKVLGLEDRTAGFYRDNLPPTTERILNAMRGFK